MSDYKGKKILFIIPSYEIGGAERQVCNLAIYYSERGANVSVLTVDGKKNGPLYSQLQQKGINCYSVQIDIYFFDKFKNYLPTPSNLRFLKKMFAQVKEIKKIFKSLSPQIIFPFCYTPNVIANNFYDAKNSFCIWNQRDLGIPPFNYSSYEKRALKKTKKIIANSGAGAKYVSEITKLPIENIRVITNAVVLETAKTTREEFRKKIGVKEETVLITMLANFSGNKDQETVVRAMKLIANKNCKLLLAGRFDGSEKNILNLVTELDLSGKVSIMPFLEDISGVYLASDIAVHSSLSEGLPNSLLEAMIYSLPVVASDIITHSKVLQNDKNLLFAPKNSAELAEKLAKLIDNKELRLKYGTTFKKIIEKDYTVEKVAEQYMQLITTS